MSQASKPTGFFGRMQAKAMARGHKEIYKETLKVMNPKKDDKYLEIGFGSGIFIKKYMSHVSKIAGIDHSDDMVKLASDINREHVESGKAEFKHGSASSLPWADNEFTIVASIEVFFSVNEPDKAIKEIYRVLKPGGRVVIEMGFNKDDGVDHTKYIKKLGLKLYSGEEMKNLLKKAGLNDIVISYYKAFKVPIKGYIFPKGMVVKAIKK